jgi:hypothetical protein
MSLSGLRVCVHSHQRHDVTIVINPVRQYMLTKGVHRTDHLVIWSCCCSTSSHMSYSH